MVGLHPQLNGHESEQTPGDGEGQGILMCCSPWGRKESDTTESLSNNNETKVGKDFKPWVLPSVWKVRILQS